jgi:hypothetical protein
MIRDITYYPKLDGFLVVSSASVFFWDKNKTFTTLQDLTIPSDQPYPASVTGIALDPKTNKLFLSANYYDTDNSAWLMQQLFTNSIWILAL